jgi:hypothetical protein
VLCWKTSTCTGPVAAGVRASENDSPPPRRGRAEKLRRPGVISQDGEGPAMGAGSVLVVGGATGAGGTHAALPSRRKASVSTRAAGSWLRSGRQPSTAIAVGPMSTFCAWSRLTSVSSRRASRTPVMRCWRTSSLPETTAMKLSDVYGLPWLPVSAAPPSSKAKPSFAVT